jgi:hypothetical protein
MYTARYFQGVKMALRHYILHDRKNKIVVFEEMIDGKSFIFVRNNGEITQYPIGVWRKIHDAWAQNKWSEKWDDLDTCVPPTSLEEANNG